MRFFAEFTLSGALILRYAQNDRERRTQNDRSRRNDMGEGMTNAQPVMLNPSPFVTLSETKGLAFGSG